MKTYIIKITDSTGMEHHHLIEDENDLQILKAVLNRVEKLATQKVNELSKGAVISTLPLCKNCGGDDSTVGSFGVRTCDDCGEVIKEQMPLP